jgi:tetratricopeptide (TPR) repeat protein
MSPRKRSTDLQNSLNNEEIGPTAGRKGLRQNSAWAIVFWTVLSILVLVLVLNYDRRSSAEGMAHLQEASRLEKLGQLDDAMAEYRLALRNPRLGNVHRAEAAVQLADLELSYRNNRDAARILYKEARRLSYRVADKYQITQRLEQLGPVSPTTPGTTPTDAALQYRAGIRISQPMIETSGPILAVLPSGRPLHTEAFRTRLARAGRLENLDLRNEPVQFERELVGWIAEELAIDRALDMGLHQDDAVLEQTWSLFRSLLRQRGQNVLRQVDPQELEQEIRRDYDQRKQEFQRPGLLRVQAIFTDSEATIREVQNLLQEGRSFEGLATTHSLHRESAAKGGVLPDIPSGQKTLPIFGEAAELVGKLWEFPLMTVSSPIQHGNNWAIFRVLERTQEVFVSFEEARPRLLLAARQRLESRLKTPTTLEDIDVSVNPQVLREFWGPQDSPQVRPESDRSTAP